MDAIILRPRPFPHLNIRPMNKPQTIFPGDLVTSNSSPDMGTMIVFEVNRIEFQEGDRTTFYFRVKAEGENGSATGAEYHFTKITT